MLDMNIVNVGLADISRAFGISPGAAQWAALGYQLPVVALLIPAGRWLDQVGLRPALTGDRRPHIGPKAWRGRRSRSGAPFLVDALQPLS
ncbi:hypothetical protein [Saccharopolyspora sp. NPDC002376]